MIGECLNFISTETGLVSSLFLAGLFGGVTHCSVMCGPFVLAQSSKDADAKGGIISKLSGSALMPYHLGRMTTYVLLALGVSTILNLALITSEFRHILSAFMLGLAGLIFLVSSIKSLSDIFPWVARLHIPMMFKVPSLLLSRISSQSSLWKNYAIGVLLGFMPCGLVLAALMATSTASNPLMAALAMSAFTFGTMPALWGVAFAGQNAQGFNTQLKKYFSSSAMVLSAVMLFLLAGKSLS